MTIQRTTRVLLGYLAVVSAQIGFWAAAAPRSFYDGFPGLGRTWVSVDGPFNEHLVRDIGALNLALATLFAVALIRLDRDLIVMSGVLAMVWGVPHASYHLMNTDGLDAADLTASLLGLVFFVAVGGALTYLAGHIADERAVAS